MYSEILYNVQDPVATITLNRPEKLNALTGRMLQELEQALAEAEASRDVVGIVLTGAGRGFCAGVDMGELQRIQQVGNASIMRTDARAACRPGDPDLGPDFGAGLSYLLTLRKPLLAAVNGACAGMGFSLAMFCDLRIADEVAVFTTSFAQRGLVAEHGLSWLLPRLIGPSRALDILWSGRKFDGREALALGIANRAVPAGQALGEAQAYMRDLAGSCAPSSLMQMKRQVYRHLMLTLGPAMEETEQTVADSLKQPAFLEGIDSFRERRPPRFGRLSSSN